MNFANFRPRKTIQAITRCFGSAAAAESLVKTALYDLHLSLGGKMVPFAGYELPVQYEGILVQMSTSIHECVHSIFQVIVSSLLMQQEWVF
jgi:hypothetical protein